jgi:uncharacterized RDD family membrane protein YckC
MPADPPAPARRTDGAPPGGERLVNAEAVELDVRSARLGSRALALLIDIAAQALLFLLLLAVLLIGLSLMPGDLVDDAFIETAFRIGLVLVLIVYPATCETLSNGRSLGKLAVGLRVVREDGGPIRARHAFTRSLVGVAVEWPGLIMPLVTWVVSLSAMLFSARGRRLGDLAAGTRVIHERTPATWGRVPAMPPALARWAAGLDLTAVDDDLALAVRHYLARGTAIRQPHRGRLGRELATEVAARVAPPPPHGTPEWLFLTAVLAERRRRAGRRLLASRALTQRMWPGFGRLDHSYAPPEEGFPAERSPAADQPRAGHTTGG